MLHPQLHSLLKSPLYVHSSGHTIIWLKDEYICYFYDIINMRLTESYQESVQQCAERFPQCFRQTCLLDLTLSGKHILV